MNHLKVLPSPSAGFCFFFFFYFFFFVCCVIGGCQNWCFTATNWKGGWVTRPTVALKKEKTWKL